MLHVRMLSVSLSEEYISNHGTSNTIQKYLLSYSYWIFTFLSLNCTPLNNQEAERDLRIPVSFNHSI
jgi:hypothetical protein